VGGGGGGAGARICIRPNSPNSARVIPTRSRTLTRACLLRGAASARKPTRGRSYGCSEGRGFGRRSGMSRRRGARVAGEPVQRGEEIELSPELDGDSSPRNLDSSRELGSVPAAKKGLAVCVRRVGTSRWMLIPFASRRAHPRRTFGERESFLGSGGRIGSKLGSWATILSSWRPRGRPEEYEMSRLPGVSRSPVRGRRREPAPARAGPLPRSLRGRRCLAPAATHLFGPRFKGRPGRRPVGPAPCRLRPTTRNRGRGTMSRVHSHEEWVVDASRRRTAWGGPRRRTRPPAGRAKGAHHMARPRAAKSGALGPSGCHKIVILVA